MRRYFYKLNDTWLPCFANSRAEAMDMLLEKPEEILTERQAQKLAENDEDLAWCLECSLMCDLMCN